MEATLRRLVHTHGYTRVHKELHGILEEDYRFFQGLYGKEEASQEEEAKQEEEEAKQGEEEAKQKNQRESSDNSFDTLEKDMVKQADKSEAIEGATIQNDAMQGTEKKRAFPFYTIRNPENPERVARAAKRKELKDKGIRIKDILTKENLEKWLKEGRSYEAMSKEVGITALHLRKNCEKHGLEKSKRGKEIEDRKKTPDDYEAILESDEALQKKHEKCRTIAKESVKERLESGNEALDTRAGIYGIFTKNTQECIYIGSTQNFQFRYEMHRKKYENDADLFVFKVIREQGGWDNHIFVPLEYRETTNGLNVIETIWYDSLLPVGNRMRPL